MLSASGEFKNYDIMRNKFKVYDVNKLMDNLVDYLVDENYIPALFFKFSRKNFLATRGCGILTIPKAPA